MTTRAINLNGRVETLAYTVNSVCALEEMTGKSLSEALSTDMAGLRALFFCGLLRSHPDMTLDAAGDLIDQYLLSGGDLEALCDQITAALEDAGFFRRAKRNG